MKNNKTIDVSIFLKNIKYLIIPSLIVIILSNIYIFSKEKIYDMTVNIKSTISFDFSEVNGAFKDVAGSKTLSKNFIDENFQKIFEEIKHTDLNKEGTVFQLRLQNSNNQFQNILSQFQISYSSKNPNQSYSTLKEIMKASNKKLNEKKRNYFEKMFSHVTKRSDYNIEIFKSKKNTELLLLDEKIKTLKDFIVTEKLNEINSFKEDKNTELLLLDEKIKTLKEFIVIENKNYITHLEEQSKLAIKLNIDNPIRGAPGSFNQNYLGNSTDYLRGYKFLQGEIELNKNLDKDKLFGFNKELEELKLQKINKTLELENPREKSKFFARIFALNKRLDELRLQKAYKYLEIKNSIELKKKLNEDKINRLKIIAFSTPFYNNENFLEINEPTLKINDPNSFKEILRKNLFALIIGISIGVFYIIYLNRKKYLKDFLIDI